MITLEPLSQTELDAYLENAIREYADALVRAGNLQAEGALERSREEFAKLLPQGVETPKQYLYSIRVESGESIGILWFADRRETMEQGAFIYDFVIQPERRGRGYGAQAMRALEDKVRAIGLSRISLHVFGENHIARGLYTKMGYVETNVLMAKELAP
jgi:ribosomal protein S18 acetylase RimI-like enzyme